MLRLYYTDLIELTAALVFLVVFKIVLLIGMRKMSSLLSEEPTPVKSTPKLPKPLQVMRYALTGLLVLDAVWQIPPVMLKVSAQALIASGNAVPIAHWWVAHALWSNIWSVVIELSLAGLLFSFSHPVAVRISSAIIGLYGLFVWITLQHFGHLLSPSPSFLAVSPGTGLLMTITCIPLVFPELPWNRYFRWSVGLYWIAFCIALWWPLSGFWSGKGYSIVKHVHPVGLPGVLGSLFHGTVGAFASHALVTTVILGLLTLAMGVLWLRQPSVWLTVIMVIVLTCMWVLLEGFGLGGAFAFACGTAPIVGLWLFMSGIRNQMSLAK